MWKVSISVFALIFIGFVNSQQGKKLNVLVLYESLCPDSENFMRTQLGPSYNLLKNYIDVTLVPFGKSRSKNNGNQFHCQHGPAECAGNRMQSCVLHQTTNQDLQVKFAVCQMTTRNKFSIKECAESVGLSSNIDECFSSLLGTQLQLQAEKITHAYAPSFVPTIIYNRAFDQQLQNSSLGDFRGTVCRLLQQQGVISFHDTACQ